jgi:hypothetical protein
MEEKLQKQDAHRGRQGWRRCENEYLLQRLFAELLELTKALGTPAVGDAARSRVVREAADVANFAMMIADNMRPL